MISFPASAWPGRARAARSMAGGHGARRSSRGTALRAPKRRNRSTGRKRGRMRCSPRRKRRRWRLNSLGRRAAGWRCSDGDSRRLRTASGSGEKQNGSSRGGGSAHAHPKGARRGGGREGGGNVGAWGGRPVPSMQREREGAVAGGGRRS